MTLGKFLPVPLMVGLVAALWILASEIVQISPAYPLVAWVPFISWALYFMAGSKIYRLHKEFIGLTGGIVFAVILLLAFQVAAAMAGPQIWLLPLIVFVVAFVIVLLELTDWFELAPAYFFTFAGYFAYLFGGFAGKEMTVQNVAWFWVLTMIGLVLGVVTAEIRKFILTAEGIAVADQQTVFDRERTTTSP